MHVRTSPPKAGPGAPSISLALHSACALSRPVLRRGGGRMNGGWLVNHLPTPSAARRLSCRGQGSLTPLPHHRGVKPSGKEAPLLEHADQSDEMPANIAPLIPCLFADVIGHPIQLFRGAEGWRTTMPPCPLGRTAGVRALPWGILAEMVRLKVDLLQAVPGPILTEVHPRKVGILSIIVNNPESSKFPRPIENGRRRAIFRGRRAASRHAPTWKCSREGARHDPKAPVSLMHRGAVPVRTGPSQVIRVPSWPRGEPHYPPRLKRAHQVETHCSYPRGSPPRAYPRGAEPIHSRSRR